MPGLGFQPSWVTAVQQTDGFDLSSWLRGAQLIVERGGVCLPTLRGLILAAHTARHWTSSELASGCVSVSYEGTAHNLWVVYEGRLFGGTSITPPLTQGGFLYLRRD